MEHSPKNMSETPASHRGSGAPTINAATVREAGKIISAFFQECRESGTTKRHPALGDAIDRAEEAMKEIAALVAEE